MVQLFSIRQIPVPSVRLSTPLVLTFIGMYIQGEGCIIVAYPKEKEQLFLSPGKGIFAVGIYVSVYRQKFSVG